MRNYRELEKQFHADAAAYLCFTHECLGCRHARASWSDEYHQFRAFDDYLHALARRFDEDLRNTEEEEQFMDGLENGNQDKEPDLPF